ncbi:unnamed protein product, partial [Pocillopora meandrina]
YLNAQHWSTRRQILSLMADKLSLKEMREFIPTVTSYRYNIARRHRLIHGRAAPLPNQEKRRMRIEPVKLEHFVSFITSPHVIQDVPFGEKLLKLSTGEIIKTPNVIRTMIPERIVQQYQQYCCETNFEPMSKRTLQRVLAVCSSSVWKSLQGLDNFSASGQWAREIKQQLRLSKQYLKGDYKVHAVEASEVPDHCRIYALSDPSNAEFQGSCDHLHNESCEQCYDLQEVLCTIEDECSSALSSAEDQADMLHTIKQARDDIISWKAHQLRSVHQAEAKHSVLAKLDSRLVLLVQDWAMKYMPRKYREAQSDWFANVTVASIMLDCLTTLKKEIPELEMAYYKQDNAGCYHSGNSIISAKLAGDTVGVAVVRNDFSDPKGGKGVCDRKAATIKGDDGRYVNEGNDVINALQFKTAIESGQGTTGVKASYVTAKPSCTFNIKWDGISLLNNFEYSESGVRVWRAFNVGSGKVVPWAKFEGVLRQPEKLEILDPPSPNPSGSPTFKIVGHRHIKKSSPDDMLFPCPEEGCVKAYSRFANLQTHLDTGKHQMMLEQETLYDKAKREYSSKLTEGRSRIPSVQVAAQSKRDGLPPLPMGWALKKIKKKVRVTKKQTEFLTDQFQKGEYSGR